MTAARIEPMAGRHLDAVLAIDRLVYSVPWSSKTWRDELAASDRVHLVAVVEGRVVAHAGTLRQLDELHVITVATHPDHQGEGIATRLVADLLRRGVAAGAAAGTLEVRASDRRAQRMYGRLGFAPAGIRPGYYRRPDDDAVIMWLHDLQSAAVAARLDRVAPAAAETTTIETREEISS